MGDSVHLTRLAIQRMLNGLLKFKDVKYTDYTIHPDGVVTGGAEGKLSVCLRIRPCYDEDEFTGKIDIIGVDPENDDELLCMTTIEIKNSKAFTFPNIQFDHPVKLT